MKYPVTRFKGLAVEIEPFIRNGQHLQTGKPLNAIFMGGYAPRRNSPARTRSRTRTLHDGSIRSKSGFPFWCESSSAAATSPASKC
jgi:hypothetical protein